MVRTCEAFFGRVKIYQGNGLRQNSQTTTQEWKEKEINMAVNHDAHGLKAYYHDCVMTEEDRLDKHGEPVNYVYAKLKADRVIYAEKHKRSLLYAKNHILEAQKAQDAIRMLCLNSKGLTKQQCDDFVSYWFRVRDNHTKHYTEWLKYAEYFKSRKEDK